MLCKNLRANCPDCALRNHYRNYVARKNRKILADRKRDGRRTGKGAGSAGRITFFAASVHMRFAGQTPPRRSISKRQQLRSISSSCCRPHCMRDFTPESEMARHSAGSKAYFGIGFASLQGKQNSKATSFSVGTFRFNSSAVSVAD